MDVEAQLYHDVGLKGDREKFQISRFDKPNHIAGRYEAGPWRSFAVDVSPTEVVISLKDESGTYVRRAGWVNGVGNAKTVTRLLNQAIQGRYPNTDATASCVVPRGGLGITLYNATAEYRNVIIQPLE